MISKGIVRKPTSAAKTCHVFGKRAVKVSAKHGSKSAFSTQDRDRGLLCYYEDGLPVAMRLRKGVTTVGRPDVDGSTGAPDVDESAGAPDAGRGHVTILYRDGAYYIRDDDSRNGTFLNGIRLQGHQEVKLAPGDRISVATVKMIFKMPRALQG